MRAYVTLWEGQQRLTIRARAEGPGGIVGDLREDLGPGEEFYGWSFEELVARGPGQIRCPKPMAGRKARRKRAG